MNHSAVRIGSQKGASGRSLTARVVPSSGGINWRVAAGFAAISAMIEPVTKAGEEAAGA